MASINYMKFGFSEATQAFHAGIAVVNGLVHTEIFCENVRVLLEIRSRGYPVASAL